MTAGPPAGGIPVAVLDACVLYPAFLRDVLLRLAAADLLHPRWTDEIHDEWTRSLAADRPDLPLERIAGIRAKMESFFREARVTGHERHIPALELPDEGDRHVLAAAIEARADWIVTLNVRDFPSERLEQYSLRAVTPDDVLNWLLDDDFVTTVRVLDAHRRGLERPPMPPEGYRSSLASHARMPMAAARLPVDLRS